MQVWSPCSTPALTSKDSPSGVKRCKCDHPAVLPPWLQKTHYLMLKAASVITLQYSRLASKDSPSGFKSCKCDHPAVLPPWLQKSHQLVLKLQVWSPCSTPALLQKTHHLVLKGASVITLQYSRLASKDSPSGVKSCKCDNPAVLPPWLQKSHQLVLKLWTTNDTSKNLYIIRKISVLYLFS